MGSGGNLWTLIQLAIVVFTVVGMWKVFTMAGKPGWASLIPFYNFYVILEIGDEPGWWVLLLLVPFLNILVLIYALISLARSFGKGVGFGLGLTFLPFVFFPVLGFAE